jgi:hypothetical protein
MDGAKPDCDGIKLVIAEIYCIKEVEILGKLQEAVESKTLVRVFLDTPVLREPHSNLDIAEDYYTALIFGEMIAPFCAEIDCEEVPGRHGVEFIMFSLVPLDVRGLAHELAWYSQAERRFLEPDEDNWTPEFSDVDQFESLRGFNSDMNANVKRFDDLAESYVRNLEVGLTESYSGRELQEVYDSLREEYKRWWDPSLETKPLNIDVSRLAQGMTEEQVRDLFEGHFSAMCSQPIGGSRVEIGDYQADDAVENACRLWFLDGRLVFWCTGEAANDPMDLRSPHAPDFVKRLLGPQGSGSD